MRFYFYIKINLLSNYIMDLSKFIYNDIGDNILDRLFKEGKEINKVGDLNDLLNLPKNEKLGWEEHKESSDVLQKYCDENKEFFLNIKQNIDDELEKEKEKHIKVELKE